MKIILFNGLTKNSQKYNKKIKNLLEKKCKENNWHFDFFDLTKLDIHHCIGCFNCWENTPGICIFKDSMSEILPKIISADILIYTNSLLFGGLNTIVKRNFDRKLPLISPKFAFINREIHHQKRYQKYPSIVVFNIIENNEELIQAELFDKILTGNAINFHSPWNMHFEITKTESRKQIEAAIRKIMEKIANGSN